MSEAEFDAFLQRQVQAAKSAEAFDWQSRKSAFLRALARLYDEASYFLQKYVADMTIALSRDRLIMIEEEFGNYSAPQLSIKIGTKTAKLIPVGTTIIGGFGRVDLEGPSASFALLLLRPETTSVRIHSRFGLAPPDPGETPLEAPANLDQMVWKWMGAGGDDFRPLDKDSFLEALMSAVA